MKMTISKIKQLRADKTKQVEYYKAEIEKVKNDERLSSEYKAEMIRSHEDNLRAVEQGHDEQINELISRGKTEYTNKIRQAEFEGISSDNLLRKLLIENRNRDITQRALDQYRGKETELYQIVQNEIDNQSPTAQGYINAYMRMIDDPILRSSVAQMEEEYKQNTMNVKQREYAEQLQAYEEQEQEYKEDLNARAFENVVAKYK